ncbi:MAG: DUF2807 domain-containing protein [Sphingomonadales bacterium]|mgnify:CR=1 FL=1|nr:DUF2807 domain-containing protein [Sphingomonadales bacterium]
MKDKTRLAITGIVALGALVATVGGHGLKFEFGGDDEEAATAGETSRTLGDLKGFEAVALTGPDDVVIKRGTTFAVRVDGPSGALERLDLQVKDGTLHVGRKKGGVWVGGPENSAATVYVTLPALRRVSLAGSGDMSIDRLEGAQVKADLTGPGNLVIDALQADEADLSLTGSGDLSAAGRAGQAALSATGSGNLHAEKLHTDQASLRLIGSGDIAVHASRGADVSVMGSGNAQVIGTSACKISRMGSGEAQCTAG